MLDSILVVFLFLIEIKDVSLFEMFSLFSWGYMLVIL